jgi:hypothetical protein
MEILGEIEKLVQHDLLPLPLAPQAIEPAQATQAATGHRAMRRETKTAVMLLEAVRIPCYLSNRFIQTRILTVRSELLLTGYPTKLRGLLAIFWAIRVELLPFSHGSAPS